MAIYRGDGGAGDATNDITINQITELSSDAQAAAAAAASSATSASSSASAASTSATNAANSATAASTSETNAATSETNAATSASNASTSETNAAASETAAAASETAAALSETAAAASETNAASSASSASTSASTATTQASNAATSATNAANSASAASTSETNAATSETNAATSETNAATSETNAAASATAAAASAASAASSDYAVSSWFSTTNNASNWDTAYGWGNHSSAGYLTSYTETDPIYTASSWHTTTNNSSNWDTAYGWGDHASAGYVVADGAVVINESGANVDFRIESDTDVNAFFLKGSNGRVGIGTASPSTELDVTGDVTVTGTLKYNSGYGSVTTAYGCRAWVNFKGIGTVEIRDSGNVSSITDSGIGYYRVNFTTAMPDANYATTVGAGSPATISDQSIYNQTAAYFEVRTGTYGIGITNYYTDALTVCIAIFR